VASKVIMEHKSVEFLSVGSTSLPLESVTFMVHYLLWKFLTGDFHNTSIGLCMSFTSGKHATCMKYRNFYDEI